MTEKESNSNDKTPFAAVMPRSSSFILLSAEKHSQRFSENDCPVENMTYEQLLQLQYLPHKPIIRQPVCTYSVPKTFKSSCRKYHSENPTPIHDGAQEKNVKQDSDEFGQTDTEEIDRVEQSISKIEKRCCDTDNLLPHHASSETNAGITSAQNTENGPKIFKKDFYVLRENTEMLANVFDKFEEKQFQTEKQSDKDDDHKSKEESNEIAIKPNVLFQEKMDRNEKVTNFLKGLPEMTSTSCNLKNASSGKEKATTSDDPKDIHPVRSTSGNLDYEEDFESCSNDTNDESESTTDSHFSDFLEKLENSFLLKEKASNSNKKEKKPIPKNSIESQSNFFRFAPLISIRRQSNKRKKLKKSQAEINSLLDDLLGYDDDANES